MKKFLKSVGNFFKKIGLFIWKYVKIAWNYVKENAWIQPIAIVALIFGLVFGVQGIIDGVEKIKANAAEKETTSKDLFTKLTMKQTLDKIDADHDFVLFIGSRDCYHCQDFKPIINKYIATSTSANKPEIYFIDIGDTSDYTLKSNYLNEWVEKLQQIETRDFGDSLSTPTVVIIRDGEFVDAKAGAQALNGGMEYLSFVKFVEGEYIGKVE